MPLHRAARSARFAVRALGLTALAGLALLAAGCGGGSASPPVASLGGTHPTTSPAATSPGGPAIGAQGGGGGTVSMDVGTGNGTKFSACMRSHGVPNFPDPDSQGQITFGSSDGINPGSPQVQSAQKACQKLLPHGGTLSPARQAKMQAMALKFSACMRSHGVPKFPDPTFSGGGVSLKITRGGDLDPNSPQFQAAQKACQGDRPGLPTTAKSGGPGGGTNQTQKAAP